VQRYFDPDAQRGRTLEVRPGERKGALMISEARDGESARVARSERAGATRQIEEPRLDRLGRHEALAARDIGQLDQAAIPLIETYEQPRIQNPDRVTRHLGGKGLGVSK
jgi:hypothetical protein